MNFKRISVIGLGYIGLPTAAVFASRKIEVIGVDINQSAVDIINKGGIHIVEPDLDMVVHAAVTEGYLRATLTPEPSEAFLIAVPTPFKNCSSSNSVIDNKRDLEIPDPDLAYIEAACLAIAPVLKKGNLIVLESTSPVGTTEKVAEWLQKSRPDLTFPQTLGEDSDIRIAYCPERVLPGHVLRELIQNDRVIGGMTDKCSNMACSLYEHFVEGKCIVTSARTAEMAKLTENSYRDVNIAFANELSIICDRLEINVWELIALSNRHPRVDILHPGPGVGGHCIAVDPWFIVSKTPEEARLISTARKVNDAKPSWVLEKVKVAISDFLQANPSKTTKDVNVVCYGLVFKPDIDDMRQSPALDITKEIALFHQGKVFAVEPNINKLPNDMTGVDLIDFENSFSIADVAVMLVDNKEFKGSSLPSEYLIDTKGLWDVKS